MLFRSPSLGGLVGWSQGRIVDSYARGSVSNPVASGHKQIASVGGVAGAIVPNDFALAQVYATGVLSMKRGYLGGVIGYDYLSEPEQKRNAYWDLDTTGVSDTSKGAGNIGLDKHLKGLHTSQLTHGLPNGFDPAIWGQKADVNDGYPYLLANPPQ